MHRAAVGRMIRDQCKKKLVKTLASHARVKHAILSLLQGVLYLSEVFENGLKCQQGF